MQAARVDEHEGGSVRVTNRTGGSPFVLLCDHASNAIPPEYGTLGLAEAELQRHIAWDPGALPVAQMIAEKLDAALVQSCISRLVIDCNRPLDAPDLVPEVSETTAIPGNAGLSAEERTRRIALSWRPFHTAVADLLGYRAARGMPIRLISIHSFTPVYKGIQRPWEIGVIHDDDTRLAAPLIARLQAKAGIHVGVNQPYSPADRVYYSLSRHGSSRGYPSAMIEIRNDEIANKAAQKRWAATLTGMLREVEPLPAANPPHAAAG